MKPNPLDLETARAAAQRLYKKISFSGRALQSYEISSLLTDTYQYLKIPFKPTARDIKAYGQILDANHDGEVDLADMEARAIEYLCGPGVLSQQSAGYSNKKLSYELHGSSAASYSQSFQQMAPSSNRNIPTSNSSNWQPRSNKFDEKSLSANISNQSSSTTYYNQTTTTVSNHTQVAQRDYNEQTQHYLALTLSVFQRYATTYNTITTDRVMGLLKETYETLGNKNYKPSEEDVQVWMRLCDGNNDGHVQYDEYCKFVVGSMERSGFNVYK